MDTTHECPMPGCAKRVPRHMLTCKAHWFRIPKMIRDDVWDAYKSGDGERHAKAITAAVAHLRSLGSIEG